MGEPSFDRRNLARFATDEVGWLATVRADGRPQASPIWFVWDDDRFLIYSQPGAQKLRNIEDNPWVCLHLDGGRDAGTTLIVEGQARIASGPSADRHEAYVEKYGAAIAGNGWTPHSFAADYSVPLDVVPDRIRAW
jgi:PPOX class probable F420-dependent enzyme